MNIQSAAISISVSTLLLIVSGISFIAYAQTSSTTQNQTRETRVNSALTAEEIVRIQAQANVVNQEITSSIERMRNIIGRIETRIGKIQGDTSQAQLDLAEAKASLIKAEAAMENVELGIDDLFVSEDPATTWSTVKDLYAVVNIHLSDGKQSLFQTVISLKEATENAQNTTSQAAPDSTTNTDAS